MCNAHDKVKTFQTINSRKFRANVDSPFGLKRFALYAYIPDKVLA